VSRGGRIIAVLRPATLVAGGAFAVHQLSYLVGGAGAPQGQDHSYMGGLVPLLAVLVALTVLGTVEGGLAGGHRPGRRWFALGGALTYGGAIFAAFAVQEVAESMMAGNGLTVFVAPIGLAAIPISLAFGALAWLTVRSLEAVEGRIAARFAPVDHGAARAGVRPRWLALVLCPALVPGGAAPRAPPSI
jgi:hypothetical protein